MTRRRANALFPSTVCNAKGKHGRAQFEQYVGPQTDRPVM